MSESLSLGERVREEERKREREREKVRNAEKGWEHRLCQSETKIQKKMIVVPKSHTCRWNLSQPKLQTPLKVVSDLMNIYPSASVAFRYDDHFFCIFVSD